MIRTLSNYTNSFLDSFDKKIFSGPCKAVKITLVALTIIGTLAVILSVIRSHMKQDVIQAKWNDSIEFKLKLYRKSFKKFEDIKVGLTSECKETAEKVNKYFLSVIGKLEKGENVAVPLFYHASKNPDGIVHDNKIKMSTSQGMTRGTYFSNCDEYYYLERGSHFGEITFAFDPCLVEDKTKSVCYHSMKEIGCGGQNCYPHHEEGPLWMCLEDNDMSFDDTKAGLAYAIVTDKSEAQKKADNPKWQHVAVVTRDEADLIRRCIKT